MSTLVERLRGATDPLDTVREAPATSRRSAAVLLLFDTREDGLPLLFMQRTDHLRHHAGQIAFPGGGTEPSDGSVADTALREAGEEAGIPATAVEVIGLLPPFLTAMSDNWLTPVVGVHDRPIELRPDTFEVARLFHLDLRALMNAPHTVRTLTHEGRSREVHFYEADGNVVWGVTAAILNELITRIGTD
ncbi:MAG: CoA pyrophosphatase [Candidatus Dormibacteraeota bacterium]|nr:CoA pyrophosphatase [Candidatus Dormibacteraeota bacterium]